MDNRGVAYAKLGRYARAIQDFDRAIRLNPNDAIAYSGRSFAKRKLGDSAGAAADLAKAKAIDPDIGGTANSSSPSSNAPANNATSGLGNTLQQAAAPPNAPAGSVTAAAPANDATTGSDAIEIEYWKSIQNSKDPADFEAYLKKFGNGHFADLARNRLAALRAPVDVCQSMAGTWSWFINGGVTFDAGGTAKQPRSGWAGTWTCHDGAVKIFWPLGIVDTLTLSSDGKHLRGHGGFLGLDTVSGDRKENTAGTP